MISNALNELASALCKAQLKIRAASKDSTNPHFKSRYADLASVWEACREPLASNGLSVIQQVSADGPKVTVTTMLLHSSGQFISSDLTMTAAQNTPQGIGSCITYGRRYGLSAMVGITQDDDDGNAASAGESKEETTKPSVGDIYTGNAAQQAALKEHLVKRGIAEDHWEAIHKAMIGKMATPASLSMVLKAI